MKDEQKQRILFVDMPVGGLIERVEKRHKRRDGKYTEG